MLNKKAMIILLTVALIKHSIRNEYFPERRSSRGSVKFELHLSNYATKVDLKNGTGVNTSKCAKNVDLASLKYEADKLDIDKLKNVPTNISNLESKVDKLDVDKLVPCSC